MCLNYLLFYLYNLNIIADTNEILKKLTFLKYEIKQVLSNQVLILQKIEATESILERLDSNSVGFDKNKELNRLDFADCPLPIDNMVDLNTLDDKISGDHNFKNQLVSKNMNFFILSITIVQYSFIMSCV